MQNLDKIPKWKVKLGENKQADSDLGNAAPTSEEATASSSGGIPWIPIIIGCLVAVGIYATFQNKKDDVKK
jgi:hypothetical protein